ncbi:MAG: hypothetical protein HY899_00395 [Deltaproteobacteria bacterium]|nr:hypothetical protein [Deltaproteobacteria bacterium]
MSRIAQPLGHGDVLASLRALAVALAGGSDRGLHHAWLFSGQRGVGKFLTARWWATLLKCPQVGECEPACDGCRLIAAGVHPDVVEIAIPEDKRSIGIAESRALLQRLSLRPTRSGPRIGIVRDAGAMTIDAQNAVLKLLEEPPGFAVIVLVADNAGAMLPTVRSRCRHLAFGDLAESEVAAILVSLGRSAEEAAAAAACARGSVARAQTYDAEGLAEREALLLAYEQARNGQADIDAVLQALVARKESGYALGELLEWQLTKVKSSLGNRVHEPSEPLARVLEAAAGADTAALLEEAGRIHWTMTALERNANARLAIRDLLLNVRI